MNLPELKQKIIPWLPWAVIFVSVVAVVAAMRAFGRFWICECNKVYLWTSDAWSSDNSQHLFDPYSFSHIEHGILFFAVIWFFAKRYTWQWRLTIVMLLEVGWEILENSPLIINRYRATTAALGYTGDTVVNAIGDVLAAAVGFFIIERYGWKWAATALIAVELALLFFIRDNLFLNILMLLIPVTAIQEWQLALH